MSVQNGILLLLQRKEVKMISTARAYSIVDLLEGKFYQSRSNPARKGIIQSAELRKDTSFTNGNAYLVRVRPATVVGNRLASEDFYATVAVFTEGDE